ncbi:MAG: site-specific integrase [Deltaproteobacteria bacterium]|nr:site-specific integrase [Deltaproteobacteria bacterium]
MAIHKVKRGWQIDYRDQDGKRHRKTVRLRADAERELRAIKDKVDDKTYISPRQIPTFKQAAEEWFAGKRGYRPATLAYWRVHLDLHLIPKLGSFRLNCIDVGPMERVRDELQDSGLSHKSTNKILTTASSIFKFAIRHRYTRQNPAKDVERARKKTEEMNEKGEEKAQQREVRPEDVFTEEEIRRLIQNATPGFDRTLLLTAALTGVRDGELFALQWGDMDLEKGEVKIQRSLSWAKVRGEHSEPKPRFFPPKTEAGVRILPLPPEFVSALKAWKIQCPPNERDLVFATKSGKPLQRSWVLRCVLRPTLSRAKLRTIALHTLRHSFASVLIEAGAPINQVQYLLGHSKPTTTLQVYTHWFKGKVKSPVVSALAKAICPSGHFLDTFQERNVKVAENIGIIPRGTRTLPRAIPVSPRR